MAGTKKGNAFKKLLPDSKIGQGAAKTRVRREFPPARNFVCSDCGKPAREYDHPFGYKENWNKVEPVCRSCHLKREYRRGRPCGRRKTLDILIGPRMEKGYFYSETRSLKNAS